MASSGDPVAVLVPRGDGPRADEWHAAALAAVAEHTSHQHRVYAAPQRGLHRLYEEAREDGAARFVALAPGALPVQQGWLVGLLTPLDAGAAVVGAWSATGEAACFATTVAFVDSHGLDFGGDIQASEGAATTAEGRVVSLPRSGQVGSSDYPGAIYGDALYLHGAPGPGSNEQRIGELGARMLLEHRDDYLGWLRREPVAGRVLVILGMHRSGTSCLLGCLEQCGVNLGDVARRSVSQPLGNLEQRRVMLLNEAMLNQAGGSWRCPPGGSIAPLAETSEVAAVVRDLEAAAPSALKDPRLLFTLDTWLSVVERPVLLGTFRHPEAVARSLWQRDGIRPPDAYAMWQDYNARLVARHRQHGFPLVEFDLSDHEAYCRIMAALAAELGLEPRLDAIRNTVQEALASTTVAADAHVPEPCAATYAYLRRHRYDGRLDPRSFAALLVEWGSLTGGPRRPRVSRSIGLWAWRAAARLPRPIRSIVQRQSRWVARRLRSRS